MDVHAHVTLTLTLLDMYNKVCAVQMLLEKSLRWQLSLDPLAVIETHAALPGSSVFLFPHASILEHSLCHATHVIEMYIVGIVCIMCIVCMDCVHCVHCVHRVHHVHCLCALCASCVHRMHR